MTGAQRPAVPMWVLCPVCGAKLARRGPNAHAAGVFLWCKKCRREVALTLPACAPRPRTGLPPA